MNDTHDRCIAFIAENRPDLTPTLTPADVDAIAEKLLHDPAYVEDVKAQLVNGTAGHVELLLWYFAYGMPGDASDDQDAPTLND